MARVCRSESWASRAARCYTVPSPAATLYPRLHEACGAAQLTRTHPSPSGCSNAALSLSLSLRYYFPPEFNEDYGEPVGGALCKETAANSEIFTREYSKASVQLDCKAWKGTVTMKN